MPTKAEYDKNPERHRAYNRKYLRSWRLKNGTGTGQSKYRLPPEERSLRKRARSKVTFAIKSGSLTRERCEEPICLEMGEAHHDDYSKPLEVRWLCKTHHEFAHPHHY